MKFQDLLIEWYQIYKRDLPWRNTKDPYLIWLSEIILQQTRINQGLPYYNNFINKFPNIKYLAKAKEQDVLNLWQGLGYYSRARNLHNTAKFIAFKLNGVFPSNFDDLIKLKGIGSYTASAIMSFAYDMPYAVVDGNVVRVLSRIFGIDIPFNTYNGSKFFHQLAKEKLISNDNYRYNQAIMDFGSLVCKPQKPICIECPMNDFCIAFNTNSIPKFPFKKSKNKIKSRYFNYLIIEKNHKILIRKRKQGIWKGMFEFPYFESKKTINNSMFMKDKDCLKLLDPKNLNIKYSSEEYKHRLSHQLIYAKFWHIDCNKFNIVNSFYISKKQFNKYPVYKLIEKYFNTINID